MTREEAIKQLEGLQRYCVHNKYSDENGSYIWGEDAQALILAIAALREQPRWISVEERLPTEKDANPNKNVLAIEIREGFAREWTWDSVALYHWSFTHWMPMPKLPKENA